jgi:hypothetical protein
MTINAQDQSEIAGGFFYWTNPAGGSSSWYCSVFSSGTCSSTKMIGSSGWSFSGTYELSYLILRDSNNLDRYYYPNGTWNDGNGSGTFGFSLPNVTVQ